MKKAIDKKKFLKRMLIICSILIVCILLLLVILIATTKKEEPETITQEERKNTVTNIVRTKSEKERIKIYLAEYLKYIERKEYELAYGLLGQQFKDNFFNTIEEYIYYIEQNYSELMSVDYKDISRQGNYYILSVEITNIDIEEVKEQKFIIYENAVNDYTLSFQVK